MNKKVDLNDLNKWEIEPLDVEQLELEHVNDNPMSKRLKQILSISSIEKLNVSDDKSGIELNEGYEFELNGAIPEIADGLAKMLIEMDKSNDLGENAGSYFISLVIEYYNRLKGGE